MKREEYSLYSNEAGPCVVVTKSEPFVTVRSVATGFDDKNEIPTKAALGHFKNCS
jgi:hypothetical protein